MATYDPNYKFTSGAFGQTDTTGFGSYVDDPAPGWISGNAVDVNQLIASQPPNFLGSNRTYGDTATNLALWASIYGMTPEQFLQAQYGAGTYDVANQRYIPNDPMMLVQPNSLVNLIGGNGGDLFTNFMDAGGGVAATAAIFGAAGPFGSGGSGYTGLAGSADQAVSGGSMWDWADPSTWTQSAWDSTFPSDTALFPTDAALPDATTVADNTLAGSGGTWAGTGTGGISLTDIAKRVAQIPGGSSVASRILNGSATPADWLQAAGALGTTVAGLIGADASRSANNAAADKMLALGEPARTAYNATLQPGWNPTSIPGYQGAIDSVMNSYLRKASTGGNPFSNPGVSMEAQNYTVGNTALPAINQYRNSLTAEGSIGVANANAPNLAAAQAPTNMANTVAGGLGALTTPTTDIATLLRQLGLTGGMSSLLQTSPASL